MNLKKYLTPVVCGVLSLALTMSAFSNTVPVRAEAASSSAIREQINGLKDELSDVRKEIEGLEADLKENMNEIEKMVAEKNVIDQEIALLTQEIQLINEQILAYGLLIADKQDQLDAAQAQLEALTEQNKERIRAMEEDGDLSYWSVLFRANDFADLLDRLNMIEEIAAADRRRLEQMRVAKQAVQTAQDELTKEKAAMEESRVELEKSQTLLAQKRVEADKKLAELNARNEEFLALLEEAEAADNALMQQIAQKEKEYNAAKAAENAAAAPPPAVDNGSGVMRPPQTVTNGITWTMPCAYTRLSSPYGWRVHPVYGYPKFHDGVDLANSSGTPIVATRSGTVTLAVYSTTAGNYVTINHGDGFSSVYMHMTHYIVSIGQKVSAGQIIGYMGSTGVSTGPHLHFSITYQGYSQNPADYLNFY